MYQNQIDEFMEDFRRNTDLNAHFDGEKTASKKKHVVFYDTNDAVKIYSKRSENVSMPSRRAYVIRIVSSQRKKFT